jgi:hypothetical protein
LEAKLAAKRVKKKEGEKLSFENVEHVIMLLEQGKPISKKEACQILNITYNTTRLGNIIESHKEQKARDEKRRAANRGKPASNQEIKDVIEWYLEGDSLKDISQRLYRSTTFIKNIVDVVGVPQRKAGQNYLVFEPLPEQCISDRFEPGELVWSSRYQALAQVVKERGPTSDGISTVYQIYVLEKLEEKSPYFLHGDVGGFYANQPTYDLGKLTHLEKYDVNLRKALNAVGPRSSDSES